MIFAHFMNKNKDALKSPFHLLLSISAVLSIMFAFNLAGGYFGTPHLSMWVVWPAIEAMMWAYFACSYMRCLMILPSIPDKIIRFLGETSYSIYIMHMVAISFMYKFMPRVNIFDTERTDALVTSFVVAFPASIALAICTFFLIEKPFFHLKKKYTVPINESSK